MSKHTSYIILLLLAILLLTSGIFAVASAEEPSVREIVFRTGDPLEGVDEFLALVYGDEIPTVNHWRNVTPDEVAAETDYQIFRNGSSADSVVVVNNGIYQICTWFGGHGFINAVPCDYDEDGVTDLLVACSWGSGLHRGEISLFNGATKEISSIQHFKNQDVIIIRLDTWLASSTVDFDPRRRYSYLVFAIDEIMYYHSVHFHMFDDLLGFVSLSSEDGTPVYIPYEVIQEREEWIMEKLFRALGMVDKDGNVFDETKIREQVMSALGVSKPTIETVPAPKPPFDNYDDCYEACLALPTPLDDDFEQGSASARALAVAVIFEMEYSCGGIQQYLWNSGSAYAMKTADSLRKIGLSEHAAAFEAYLAAYQFDAERIDAMHPADDDDKEVSRKAFTDLIHLYPSDDFDHAADWSLLQNASLEYANAHPEAFAFEE